MSLRFEMSFSGVTVAAKRYGLAAITALALPVAAQQSIQFSKPANQDPAASANAFLPTQHRDPSAFNAPSSLFGSPSVSFDRLPGSPPVMLSPNAAQWQKVLQERKNWGLLTPAQILGVPTPESILGITDPEDDPKLTPEERFLKRQDQEARMGLTNALAQPNDFVWHNDDGSKSVFENGQDRENTGFMARPDGERRQKIPGMMENQSPFFNQRPRADANQQVVDTTWTSAFKSPEPLPKPTPEQLAGMERFRALFDPTPAPTTPSTTPGTFASPSTPAPDPYLERPSTPFNPAGYAPVGLQSGVSRPTGLTPLSGISGPHPAPAKPTPLTQTPPWMSQTPQIGTLPQRQF